MSRAENPSLGQPVELDDVRAGDRVVVSYETHNSKPRAFAGIVVATTPSLDPKSRLWSASIDADDGRSYRVMYGGGINHLRDDQPETGVGVGATLTREARQ